MATLGFQSGNETGVATRDVISHSLEVVENPLQKVSFTFPVNVIHKSLQI